MIFEHFNKFKKFADSEESIGTYKGHILTLYRPYKKAIKIYPIKTLYGVFFGTHILRG